MQDGIPPEKVMPWFSQILDGVEAAHLQNVYHRDLKPENVLLDPSSDSIVIADFGIAHFSEGELCTAVVTQDHERLANFQYAAPEQRARGQAVDQRADIFALGLILNEMFTGAVPHGTGYTLISKVAGDYGYLDELVEQMLSQEPQGRPPSTDAIKQQLIARRNEFVTRQKLSQLRSAVVPAHEIDDPLVLDPPRLVGVDYEGGKLVLRLSQKLSSAWVEAFRKVRVRYHRSGEEPSSFHFKEDRAFVSIAGQPDHFAQGLVDRFKEYLPQANDLYAAGVKKQLQRQEKMESERVQREIEEQERRQRILGNVKI
jgi:serine/threonine protein kinase